MNKSKRKISLRKAFIVSLNNFDKKELLVLIPTIKKLKSKVEDIDTAMIGVNTYCASFCLKKAQVLIVSIRNIQYQAEKKVIVETNPKSVVSNKDSDTLPLYSKYDHSIPLEKERKPDHALLYNLSSKESYTVKLYLHSHLAKRFLHTSLTSYSSLILLVKKPNRESNFVLITKDSMLSQKKLLSNTAY